MEWKELNGQIKQNKFSNIYFFTGDEEYLKDFYEKELINKIVGENFPMFNLCEFEGTKIDITELRSAVVAYPIMSPKKLIIIKDSGIFKKISADKLEFWESVFSDFPDYLHIIFRENNIDKRQKLWKMAVNISSEVTFKMLRGGDLKGWLVKHIAQNGKTISDENISYLLSKCDSTMYSLMREIEKLSSFIGKASEIERKHIDKIVTKSVESRVFEFVDALTQNDKQKAFEIIGELKILKEPNAKICSIIAKHLMGLLQTKLMKNKGENIKSIASALGTKDFVISKYLSQSNNIDIKKLNDLILKCSDMDICMKSGTFSDGYFAIEEFIVNI